MQQVIRTAPRLHPLTAAAAISVIVASLAGVGVIAGVIPTMQGTPPSPVPGITPPASAPSPTPLSALPSPVPAPANPEAPVVADKPRKSARPHALRIAAGADTAADSPSGRVGGAAYPYGSYSGYGNAPVQVSPVPNAIPAPPPVASAPPAPPARPACANCGVVEAVVESESPGAASGIGSAGGALGGAVIGRQFGRGHGQDALTVLGAIGGAIVGHQVERQMRSTKAYEVRVRMEDGSTRSVSQSMPPSWRAGDRVRIDGAALVPAPDA